VRAGVGDIVAAALLVAVAVAVVLLTLDFPPPGQPDDPGAATFPRMVAGALAVFALLLLVQGGRSEESLPRGRALLRVVGVVVLLAIYAAVLEALGFMLATMLFLVGALLLAGMRRPLMLALMPVGVSLTLFYVFSVLLRVSLPRGVLERFIF
jgi:putative tricarboxylic transport membrane protein